jgi:asparagine synthetase B (glutamine-hydrolysing)
LLWVAAEGAVGAIAVFLPEQGPAQPDIVRAMTAAAPHRGTRIGTLVHGRCALACSNPEDLPDAEIGTVDNLAVAFVGCLDNAADLARELERGGFAPTRSTQLAASLPALLAAGFQAYGEDLPARLRGVFAGAITDGERVYCFRDLIGYRPLFYRRDGRGFYAASEAKQVVAGAGIPRAPDIEVAERIFYRSVSDDTPSALSGVLRLPKATGIAVGPEGLRLRRYWDPESLLETARLSSDELRSRFVALMDQAVNRCLTGQDAVSLSGGIDSPAIAAFAAPRHLQRFGRPLHAISVVYPKYPSVDESRYVKLLADDFDIPLHTYEQTTNSLDGLARWTVLTDTPFPGASQAQYEEDYRRARALGFRSVLTGEHAEFVFAFGWNRLDHFLTHGRFGAVRGELSRRRSQGASWVSLLRLVGRSIAPDRVLVARNAIGRTRPPGVPRWIDQRKATEEEPVPVRERWRRSQLAGFIGPGIALEAEEVCQAVCGVRSRRPWTDIDLWELFLGLPAEQKFPDSRSKGLVRDLLRGRVLDEVLDRQDKTVFDEAALAEIDYAVLRRFLVAPNHHVAGVDYSVLGELLRTETLTRIDYVWARELAGIHAFLSQW